MSKPSLLRISLITFFSLTMIWLGFERESKLIVIENYAPHLINRYPKPAVAEYDKVMKKKSSFSVAAKLQSSIIFSVLYLILSTAILYLLSFSEFIAKLTIGIYLAYMILCMLLLSLGKTGIDYRLSTGISHYLEDLFLSPFFVLALAVLIKAFGFTPAAKS